VGPDLRHQQRRVTDFPRWLFNSAFVSTVLTVSRVFLDSLAGYALAGSTSAAVGSFSASSSPRRRAAHPALSDLETARAVQQLSGDDLAISVDATGYS